MRKYPGFKTVSRLLLAAIATVWLCTFNPPQAIALPDPAQLAKAVREIEYLDGMRAGLASTLEDNTEEPTLETMKEVCKPVGMKAKKLAEENNWQVKQIAKKYRNPAHKPENVQVQMALTKLDLDPELMGFWERTTVNGEPGTHYYRRINVEASCLACHGAKDDRPQFVKENYPQDLAYDFEVGDLRGMYSVFIPDEIQQGVKEAIAN